MKLGGIFSGGAAAARVAAPVVQRRGSRGPEMSEPNGGGEAAAAAGAARRALALAGLRGGSGPIGGGARLERVPGLYAALLASADATDENDFNGVRGPKRVSFADIEKDLYRTLRMSDVTALRNVLRCLSLDLPEVGYVQVRGIKLVGTKL